MRLRLVVFSVLLVGLEALAQEPTNPAEFGTAALTRQDVNRSNQFSYGVSSSSAFDDKVQGTSGQSNLTGTIQPQLGLSINRPRLQSNIFYGPSFTFSSDVATQSGTSQAVGGEFEYFFSRRFSINLRQSFVSTSNPIDSLRAAAELPGLGILERPNEFLLGARVHRTTEQVGGDGIYRLSRQTTFGVGGSFSTSSYRTLEDGSDPTQNFNSQSWSGHSFISHQLNPMYAVGFNYTAQNFSSELGGASTLTHAVLGFTTVTLRPNVQLSAFAGPEFSRMDSGLPGSLNPLLETRATSLSFGSTFAWQGERNGLSASFVQRVSDSGGTTSAAVKARMLNFRAARQLTRRISTNLFANYVSNSALGGSSVGLLPDSVTGGFGFSRPLSPSLAVGFQAFRQEFLTSTSAALGYASHDVFSVSMSYNFARPIGR